jgi:toluene monooxygenase system ferredoxin subunit
MSGACNGCAGSAITLRRGVEEILRERYEGFKEVVAHEPEGAEQGNGNGDSGLLQIHLAGAEPSNGVGSPEPEPELLQIEGLRKPVFEEVATLADLPPGQIMAVDAAGHSVLLANVDGEAYAFRNVCPTDERSPLDGGRLAGPALVCPWHNCAYDARSGKRIDDQPENPGLAVVPIAIRDGAIEVAVNVA